MLRLIINNGPRKENKIDCKPKGSKYTELPDKDIELIITAVTDVLKNKNIGDIYDFCQVCRFHHDVIEKSSPRSISVSWIYNQI